MTDEKKRDLMRTSNDMMDSGEWAVPCSNDTGPDRFDNEGCHNCLCAGGGDATPYCMSDHYTKLKKKREAESRR